MTFWKRAAKTPRICSSLLAAGLLCLPLTSCGKPAETAYSPIEMAEVLLATQPGSTELSALMPGDEDFLLQLETGYLLDADSIEDGVICTSEGFEAAEISVFQLTEEADAEDTADLLEAYIENRAAAFSGYAPEQAAIAEQGSVVTHGQYVALLICENSLAEDAFLDCFDSDPPPLPETARLEPADEEAAAPKPAAPVSDDSYDPDAILAAWQTGDLSALTPKNLAVFECCRTAVNEQLLDGMTDYERELAIHDWIVRQADYDWAVNSLRTAGEADPDNDNPYGLLIGGKAICSGYSSTFQLFMDLLEIECVTVRGTANYSRDEHAWNLVRLDGEWYCVDVTWNDPYGSSNDDDAYVRHDFFNVTSDYLRDTVHFWDETGVPECTATRHAYQY